MSVLWSLLTDTGIIQWIGGLLAVFGGVLGVWMAGKRSGRLKADNKALRDKVKREGKADEALTDEKRAGGGNADVVDRLHDRDRKW